MPTPKIPPEFDDLSTSQKIRLVQELWDRIATESDSIELTEDQRTELDRRLDAHADDPGDVVSWDEVKATIQGEK